MKQFNLDEYLANPSRKVVTGDGRKLKRILCTDAKGPYPIVALIERHDNTMDNAIQYTKDGRYFDSGTDEKDLFFAPEKKVGWVNIFKGPDGSNYSSYLIFKSKEDAEKDGKDWDNYITSVKIEWEE